MAPTPVQVARITPNGTEGVTPSFCDGANGNVVNNSRGLHLVLWHRDPNADHTVTFVTKATLDGYPVEDHVITIPASADENTTSARIVGDFPERVFGRQLEFHGDSDVIRIEAYSV